MRFSTFVTLNIFIILGISSNFMTNAYAFENSNNTRFNDISTKEEINTDKKVDLNNQHYKPVSLNDVSSGTLLFKQTDNKQFLQAPQLKTEVEIEINGMVANVRVRQKFTNTSNDWQHGVYAFPLPDNAAINQLEMRIGERVIIGEVQEKKQARQTFNNAKKSGRKAALIEQHRPNLFTTTIANIPPHKEVEIELSYFQQVDYQAEALISRLKGNANNVTQGEFSLHFPMVITPRYQPTDAKISHALQGDNSLPDLMFQAEDKFIDLSVNLFAGAALDQLNSINHSLISTQQEVGNYSLKLVNQPMKKDFKLTWQYSQQTLPQVLNFQQTYQDKKYGLLMVLPGLSALNDNNIKPLRELTFILDTSGSMAGDSLAQAKQAFKYALTSLNERDSFQLIAFNSYPTQLFKEPVSANDENKKKAWDFVLALESTGGTEIKSALDLALSEGVSTLENSVKSTMENTASHKKINRSEKLQQIVFLTDGAVGNEAEIFSEIKNKIGNKRLFTVGLGTAPNRYFMKKAAEIGRGSYQFISNHSELVKEMDRLFTKLSQPVLTDLSISLNDPNGITTVKGVSKSNLQTTPNPIPDVYAGEPLFLSYQLSGLQGKEGQSDSLLSGIYQGSAWSVTIENYQEENAEASAITRQTLLSRSKLNSKPKSESKPQSKVDTHSTPDSDAKINAKTKLEASIPPLATLWARRKIADHYRQLMLFRDAEAKANIIELALKYNLVTPFTSLVAVEKEISRPPNQTATAKQLTNTLPAGQKLPSTALNWQWQFNGALCLLIMSLISLLLMPKREKNASR